MSHSKLWMTISVPLAVVFAALASATPAMATPMNSNEVIYEQPAAPQPSQECGEASLFPTLPKTQGKPYHYQVRQNEVWAVANSGYVFDATVLTKWIVELTYSPCVVQAEGPDVVIPPFKAPMAAAEVAVPAPEPVTAVPVQPVPAAAPVPAVVVPEPAPVVSTPEPAPVATVPEMAPVAPKDESKSIQAPVAPAPESIAPATVNAPPGGVDLATVAAAEPQSNNGKLQQVFWLLAGLAVLVIIGVVINALSKRGRQAVKK